MPSHFRGPLLVSSANPPTENLGIVAAQGDADLITVFDDFDTTKAAAGFGDATSWESDGWALTDVGTPAGDTISMNASATSNGPIDSCIRIDAGTTADTGGNAQLTSTANSYDWPHLKIPSNTAGAGGATRLDNTIFAFACRIGLISNAATWDGKLFIGMGEETDTGILTAATGEIAQAEGGPLVGFHVRENGQVRGIAQRTVNTAYAAGTNFVEMYAAAAPDGNANAAWWIDLAFRIRFTDMSDDNANGFVTFYTRRPGSIPNALGPWRQHATVLANQTPNNNVTLTPMIEVVNGPTNQSDLLVDWWAFGATRFSRR